MSGSLLELSTTSTLLLESNSSVEECSKDAGMYVYALSFMIIIVRFLFFFYYLSCSNDSWYNIRAHYTGNSAQLVANTSTASAANSPPDIFYIMNFDSILRSYGECINLWSLLVV